MTAAIVPLFIPQGTTFAFGFVWCHASDAPPAPGDPYDLTGASARLQIRVKRGSPLLLEALSTGEHPMIVLGTTSVPDVFDLTNGRIDVLIPGSATDPIFTLAAQYELMVTLADPLPGSGADDVRSLLKGPVTFDPNLMEVSTP